MFLQEFIWNVRALTHSYYDGTGIPHFMQSLLIRFLNRRILLKRTSTYGNMKTGLDQVLAEKADSVKKIVNKVVKHFCLSYLFNWISLYINPIRETRLRPPHRLVPTKFWKLPACLQHYSNLLLTCTRIEENLI